MASAADGCHADAPHRADGCVHPRKRRFRPLGPSITMPSTSAVGHEGMATETPVRRPDMAAVQRTIDAVWRMESARLIAGLARMLRDLDAAEESAQDALVAALETWPRDGVPDNPGAWLTATAKRRAIDRLRRRKLIQDKHAGLAADDDPVPLALSPELAADDDIGDDLLRLVFVACHPVLPREGRVALTLRLLGGLTTAEIARAFLVPEATVAQRIVRAKRALAEADVPFEVPRREELPERLSSVLEVIYLVFNEGYAATAGEDWMRPQLCEEALRLGRIVVGLVPQEPEAHGLVALMELQASRLRARTDADGAPVLLFDQDRSRWDRLLIRRGLAALERAGRDGSHGVYGYQAAIAACHARAATPGDTDWQRIAALYAGLAQLSPSPVIELNRAVAVGMASGAADGLAIVDAIAGAPALRDYHPLHGVRGDLLERLGRLDEARQAFERAASLAGNAREREVMLARARRCAESEAYVAGA
jgi:RNA polymerase sigma factor (sigma-70 family)